MRIGIDGRFISYPQKGGFKSYVTDLINGLSEVDDKNTYIVYLDRSVHDDIFPKKTNFKTQIMHNPLPGRWWHEQFVIPSRMLRDKIDVCHFPCNTAPIYIRHPFVVTVLDAIRFLDLPQLPRPYNYKTVMEQASLLYVRHFTRKAAERAALIITISECSKKDIVTHLLIDPGKVRVIYPTLNSLFRVIREKSLIDSCRRTYNINGKYLLGFGSNMPHKNTERIIKAYACLGDDLISKYQLVLICSSLSAKVEIEALAKKTNCEGRVLQLTGVSDLDLVLLFNSSELFIFPSLYEGFGLPPLEAMACGTPVISSNTSSLPEAVGEAAILVDPYDEKEIVRAICDVLNNDVLKKDLIQRGLERVSLFRGERQALATLAAYREVSLI